MGLQRVYLDALFKEIANDGRSLKYAWDKLSPIKWREFEM